ncbi:MAG: TMEM165/GDT1 family protein, partial [Frankia sp.]|nr:TMEM165/GDT1 family protein [Frankia sp.]
AVTGAGAAAGGPARDAATAAVVGTAAATTAAPARTAKTTARAATAGSFWRVAATSFTVVFVAELGDLTQISTANLAARFGSPVTVWLGSLLALWTVAGLAIAGGRGLLRVVPVKMITRVAAAAFTALAVLSLVDVIRG